MDNILHRKGTVPLAMQSNIVSNFKDYSMHIFKKHYRAY